MRETRDPPKVINKSGVNFDFSSSEITDKTLSIVEIESFTHKFEIVSVRTIT